MHTMDSMSNITCSLPLYLQFVCLLANKLLMAGYQLAPPPPPISQPLWGTPKGAESLCNRIQSDDLRMGPGKARASLLRLPTECRTSEKTICGMKKSPRIGRMGIRHRKSNPMTVSLQSPITCTTFWAHLKACLAMIIQLENEPQSKKQHQFGKLKCRDCTHPSWHLNGNGFQFGRWI